MKCRFFTEEESALLGLFCELDNLNSFVHDFVMFAQTEEAGKVKVCSRFLEHPENAIPSTIGRIVHTSTKFECCHLLCDTTPARELYVIIM